MEVCQRVLALELEIATSETTPSSKQIGALEKEFEENYMELQPASQDYQARKVAVDFVNGIVRDKLSVGDVRKQYGLCNARAFGSFAMDMFTSNSDLDISLNVELGLEVLTREERVKLLRKLAKLLYGLQSRGFVRQIQPVFKAKVPVVKFLHSSTGIECDVSIENKDGILKSEFLRVFSSIDIRFRKLCFLLKAWANGHGINSSKDHTLNSLSIILLVAVHLQTRVPAILPPFSVLLKGVDTSTASQAVSFVEHQAHSFKDFGKKNNESIVQLFKSFLMKIMVVKPLWQEGLCASAYEGNWTLTKNPSWIFVEDFSSLSQNAARAVNGIGFDAVYECCNKALLQLKSYFLGELEAQCLKSSLFNLHTASSAVNKRKREIEGNSDSCSHHSTNGFMVRLTEAQDREGTSYVPLGRVYDSGLRWPVVPVGEPISSGATLLGRGRHLGQVANFMSSLDAAGFHPDKRIRLQHYPSSMLGDSRHMTPAAMAPLQSLAGDVRAAAPSMLPLQRYPQGNDRIFVRNFDRRVQAASAQQQVQVATGMYGQEHLIGERRAERTYADANSLGVPPFVYHGASLHNELVANHHRYSDQVRFHAYLNAHDRLRR